MGVELLWAFAYRNGTRFGPPSRLLPDRGLPKDVVPRAIQLIHDGTKSAQGNTLLEVFDAMQGAVGQPDFAGERADGLVASLLPQVFG